MASLRRPRPIEPMPPRVGGPLPFVRGGLRFIAAPTEFLREARATHGDTFLLEAFGFNLMMTFAPAGLRRLYAVPEAEASFTEATRTLIGFKLPDELLEGDMGLFHKLFAGERMPGYLAHVRAAVREDLDALTRDNPRGEFEVFERSKLLIHRVAFRCWAGAEAASPRYLERLRACYERLDPEEAFVRPHRIFMTLLLRKADERKALREAEALLAEIWREQQAAGATGGDAAGADGSLLAGLLAAHAHLPESERMRAVAGQVMILHLASLSNLYAALSWTLINLLLRPDLRAQVERECAGLDALDTVGTAELAALETLDGVIHESIRMAQYSITLRRVLSPCELDDGTQRYTLQPGVLLATMLSVTNPEAPGLERFDPGHYCRGRLSADIELPARECVSTFGHGLHTCPGQRFAVAAIKLAVAGYLSALELEPAFERASPPRGQLGAVARSAEPCVVRYSLRGTT